MWSSISIFLFGGGLVLPRSVVFCPSFFQRNKHQSDLFAFFGGEKLAEPQAPGLSSFGSDYLTLSSLFRSFLCKERKKSYKHQSRSLMGDGVLCASVILSMGPSGGGVFSFFSYRRKGWLEAPDFLSLGGGVLSLLLCFY